ncbi:AAA family ATPase [Streptomyces goshikiensis]|uniref:AAA family ATPase n=1 Tax=Streptomyces goshikiensis TaxID=1942 RepID=UPI002E14E9D2|nr:AAA family ATPase [Streptomyces goshikiensis]
MTREPTPTTSARRLIVIAVTEYDDISAADQHTFTAGISAQVATVEDWWANADLDDTRRFEPTQPKQLQDLWDLRTFLFEEDLAGVDDDEALVVYITGHGIAPENSPQHFLLLPASYEDRPFSTAFPTADLIATVLDSLATHVLVMVDSCFSGRLEAELKNNLPGLRRGRRALGSLVVLAAGDDESRPRLGQFTNLLQAAHTHCKDKSNGFAEPHLSWQDWKGIVNEVFDGDTMANLHYIWPADSLTVQKAQGKPSPCLPNPGYAGAEPVLDASLSQVGWTRTELDGYWISRATGEVEAGTPGWYFTGRTVLVKQMLAFLRGTEGVLIVTGEAGSGKSALLARMVTLSDARFRADENYRSLIAAIPEELDVPEGSVDAAVLARNADPDELALALYEALGGGAQAPDAAGGRGDNQDAGPLARLRRLVRDTSRRRGRALTIVVDGIDEARNPTRVITDLLRPLTDLRMKADERPAVRLMLGIRSPRESSPSTTGTDPVSPSDLLSLLVRATHSGPQIRTDDAGATAADVTAYVLALLQAPYEGQDGSGASPSPARYQKLAEAVAREVSPSFLDARISAQRLRAMCVLPDPDDPEWLQTLRQGTEALLREDLREVALAATPAEHLMTALRASAFAQGAGTPWADIWPTAVDALSPTLVHDPDAVIRQVMDSRLTGYLTTTVEDGRTVYRPIHERISETLRNSPHTLLGSQPTDGAERLSDEEISAVHGRLTKAFGRLLPTAADQAPHPYLRRHLIAHAAAADLLDNRHVPKSFLPWETSGTVRAALGLPADPDPKTLHLAAWARIEPFLADAGISARADSLGLSALGTDLEQDSGQPAADGQRRRAHAFAVTPRWNQLRVPGNLLGRTHADLSSLVSFTLPDGSPLVAAGDQAGEVRLWDPLTGTEFGLPVRSSRHARALAVLTGHGGEPLLAVGSAHGAWIYDPQSGDVAHLPVSEMVGALAVFTTASGRVRLAVGTTTGLVICDPLARQVLSRPALETLGDTPIKALATLRLPSGRTLLAVGGDNSTTLDIIDAESLHVVTVLHGQGRGASALALYLDPAGRPRLVAASRSTGSVRNYDALTGEENQAGRIPRSAASIGLYPHPRLGTLLALGDSRGGSVSLWHPDTGEEVDQSPPDHTKRVKGMAVVDAGRRLPLVVSGSTDRTVRVWSPAALMSRWDSHLEEMGDGSHLAALPGAGGEAHVVGPARSGAVSIRSASTGDLLRQLQWPTEWGSRALAALATHTWPDGTVSVVAGLEGGFVGHWNEKSGWRRLSAVESWQSTRVRALATFATGPYDRVVLASGTSTGTVAFHDLASGEPWCSPLQERGAVRALAALPRASGTLVAFSAAAAVRLCRLGEQPHGRLPGRIGVIASLAVCPAEDGSSLLVTGGSDGSVRLWSPEMPKEEVYPVLKGHHGQVSAIALLQPSPSSQPLLATAGSQDTTVRLWDPRTGEELMRVVTGTGITSLCVLPAGSAPETTDPVIAFGGPAGTAVITVRL